MENQEALQFTIQLKLDDPDSERLDQLTRQLRREVLELDIESAELRRSGETPPGAKAGLDPLLVGTLLVAAAPTLLTQFLEFLHAWAMRREDRSVRIKIRTPEGAELEVEAPETTSPEVVQAWIQTVRAELPKARKRKPK